MKYFRVILFIAIITVSVFTLISGISHAGVVGTVHDLSQGGSIYKYQTEQVCVFCHTPHGANAAVTSRTVYNGTTQAYANNSPAANNMPILLWNRALANSFAGSGGNYQLYTSSTMTPGVTGIVGVYSLMCLSCHDGISAMNVMQVYPSDVASPPPAVIAGFATMGERTCAGYPNNICPENIGERVNATDTITHLENDHPISINYKYVYDQSVAAGENGFKTFDAAKTYVRFFPNPNDTTQPGAVEFIECPSCHNAHDKGSPIWGTEPFLVTSNIRSALCRACHNK